jgi:DNA mismatch repair protein MSH2
MPELESENKKVRDILEKCEFEVIEKSKKDFNELNTTNLNKILEKNFSTYLLEVQISTQCIQCLLEHYKLYRDETNSRQFNMGLLNITNFMRLDLAAINALMIFPNKVVKLFDSANNASTLVDYLDKCAT